MLGRGGRQCFVGQAHNALLLQQTCEDQLCCSRMHTAEPVSLMQLPDPCLLAVLQCCADDAVSLASAARAHSRLHQAAVLALSNITAYSRTQQHVDSSVVYLFNHGHHVDSLVLKGPGGSAAGSPTPQPAAAQPKDNVPGPAAAARQRVSGRAAT